MLLTRYMALWAVLGVGCGCETNPAIDAGSDAGRDFGVDLGADLGRDLGRVDLGQDGGRFDASADDPEGIGWVPLSGFPDGCVIERATHPDRLVDVSWASCGEGCQYLEDDERWYRTADDVGWHDGSQGYFVLVQATKREPLGAGRRITVIATSYGAVAGFRQPASDSFDGYCGVGSVALGDGFVAFAAGAFRADGSDIVTQLYYERLDDIAAATVPRALLDASALPIGTVLQRAQVSRHVYAAERQPGGQIFLMKPNGEFEIQVPDTVPQVPVVYGEDVFYMGFGGQVTIERTRFGETPATYLEDASAHLYGPTVTDEGLTWQRAVGPTPGTATRVDLYHSPYTDDPSELMPRLVANVVPDIDTSTRWGSQGEGIYAVPGRTIKVRLADGAVVARPLPDGGPPGNNGFLWIAGGEMAWAAGGGSVVRQTIESFRPIDP